jgi:hypothetical protein
VIACVTSSLSPKPAWNGYAAVRYRPRAANPRISSAPRISISDDGSGTPDSGVTENSPLEANSAPRMGSIKLQDPPSESMRSGRKSAILKKLIESLPSRARGGRGRGEFLSQDCDIEVGNIRVAAYRASVSSNGAAITWVAAARERHVQRVGLGGGGQLQQYHEDSPQKACCMLNTMHSCFP